MTGDWTEEVIEAGLAEIFNFKNRGDLTEEALEAALPGIVRLQQERGEVIWIMPTRMHVPRYPGESWLRWRIRVAAARRLMRYRAKRNRRPLPAKAIRHKLLGRW